ncbi:hypothetical protein N7532_000890 [Penicillium argentinense]|uniref:Uncharacterized protein n=1 Tax=Penicillium argentinense TaxID=1131581 RepID=A0A9W9KNR2_9EURO|nr:hypothetical protein N7532_000890 [Penicillium argentinense]
MSQVPAANWRTSPSKPPALPEPLMGRWCRARLPPTLQPSNRPLRQRAPPKSPPPTGEHPRAGGAAPWGGSGPAPKHPTAAVRDCPGPAPQASPPALPRTPRRARGHAAPREPTVGCESLGDASNLDPTWIPLRLDKDENNFPPCDPGAGGSGRVRGHDPPQTAGREGRGLGAAGHWSLWVGGEVGPPTCRAGLIALRLLSTDSPPTPAGRGRPLRPGRPAHATSPGVPPGAWARGVRTPDPSRWQHRRGGQSARGAIHYTACGRALASGRTGDPLPQAGGTSQVPPEQLAWAGPATGVRGPPDLARQLADPGLARGHPRPPPGVVRPQASRTVKPSLHLICDTQPRFFCLITGDWRMPSPDHSMAHDQLANWTGVVNTRWARATGAMCLPKTVRSTGESAAAARAGPGARRPHAPSKPPALPGPLMGSNKAT